MIKRGNCSLAGATNIACITNCIVIVYANIFYPELVTVFIKL